MGQKVHPIIFRIGNGATWQSRWFSGRKKYAALLEEDVKIRKFIKKQMPDAGIARIEIQRSPAQLAITIHTSKPGVIIGRGGAGIEALKMGIEQKVLKIRRNVQINISEVKNGALSPEVVLQGAIAQIEKRLPFRRVLKQSVGQIMDAGAKGARIVIAGRLNGAEIARTEKLSQGSMPLHTLRADIDYARGSAHTTYGTIGIKVWINRGDRLQQQAESQQEAASPAPRRRREWKKEQAR